MKTVTISGCSDDLVEIEGDVPGCDEINIWDKPVFVEFSNGLAFKVEYTERGVWNVDQIQHGGSLADGTVIGKEPHGEGDDPKPYSDVVSVTGPIEWVEVWHHYPPDIHDYAEKVTEAFDLKDAGDLPDYLTNDDIVQIWGILSRASRRKV
jgi:hypothetical protein